MPIKFLVLGGGEFGVLGGGKCRFCFYGRGDFSEVGVGVTGKFPKLDSVCTFDFPMNHLAEKQKTYITTTERK